MTKSKARCELEHYFGGLAELEKTFADGRINRLNYLIRKNRYRETLSDRSLLADNAMRTAVNILVSGGFFTREESKARCALADKDPKQFILWDERLRAQNMEALTYRVLEAYESVEVPSIPKPSPEA